MYPANTKQNEALLLSDKENLRQKALIEEKNAMHRKHISI